MMDRRRFLESAVACGAVGAIADGAGAEATHPSDAGIDALIARMTPREKAGQLHMEPALSYRQLDPDVAKLNPFYPPSSPEQVKARFGEQLRRIGQGLVGSLMTPMDVESLILQQRTALSARMRIPLLFAADIIHSDRTVFPVPLAEAASFDPELARRTARASAVEASARGIDVTFAPMVDIGRDQRWGRVVEGAGEDVLLGRLFAAARVRGFQGEIGAPDSMLACVKHFAAYGAAESGLDYRGAAVSDRVLHEIYLPPFQAAFDAGAILAMSAFNTIDGVPATGNRRLLTEILRGEMGFQGAVMSDYESEKELIAHGQAEDEADAVRIALTAGCDIGMVSGLYLKHIPALLQSGAIAMETLDRAVARMLFVKKRAGLFDDPFRRLDVERSRRPAPAAHRDLAREAGRRSIVLLKNDGDLLPLGKSGQKLALIGPFATDIANLHGPWSTFSAERPPVSLADGMKAAMANGDELMIVPGSAIDGPVAGGIAAAVAAARAADVVVLALGEDQAMSGEAASRADIGIPAAQQSLAEAVAATGRPMLVVLRNGRALALEGAVRDADAILVGWFLGSETGPAIADILFGDFSPSGRLPVSFPRATGQEPFYYARESSGRPAGEGLQPYRSHFIGIPDTPLYPFGHGLGYGDVRYGETRVTAGDGRITATATLANHGRRTADEVAQLYVHDRASEVVQPVRRMVDFRRLALAPGESRTIRFDISPAMLSHLDRACRRVAGEGLFDIWIAPSAAAGAPAQFRVPAVS